MHIMQMPDSTPTSTPSLPRVFITGNESGGWMIEGDGTQHELRDEFLPFSFSISLSFSNSRPSHTSFTHRNQKLKLWIRWFIHSFNPFLHSNFPPIVYLARKTRVKRTVVVVGCNLMAPSLLSCLVKGLTPSLPSFLMTNCTRVQLAAAGCAAYRGLTGCLLVWR